MNVPEMVTKYGLKPRGVIQVGSHHGEEVPVWKSMGIEQMHFEPVQSNWLVMRAKYPGLVVWPTALGNRCDAPIMFTETVNGAQSCSLLKPKIHLEILPWITFDGQERVPMVRLDDASLKLQPYNFMYIDTQGYELEVLKGATKTLAGIDFIFTEVNRAEVFEGCAQIEDIDAFLATHGFERVETEWHGGEFGDALYIKHDSSSSVSP